MSKLLRLSKEEVIKLSGSNLADYQKEMARFVEDHFARGGYDLRCWVTDTSGSEYLDYPPQRVWKIADYKEVRDYTAAKKGYLFTVADYDMVCPTIALESPDEILLSVGISEKLANLIELLDLQMNGDTKFYDLLTKIYEKYSYSYDTDLVINMTHFFSNHSKASVGFYFKNLDKIGQRGYGKEAVSLVDKIIKILRQNQIY